MTGIGAAVAQWDGSGPIEALKRNGGGKTTERPRSGIGGLGKDAGWFMAGSKGTEGSARGRGKRPRREDRGPEAGSIAPVFKLKSLDGKREFDLEAFKGRKPVILFFGSYT